MWGNLPFTTWTGLENTTQIDINAEPEKQVWFFTKDE